MGCVISDCQCPNCKRNATEDFNYKTNEIYVFCSHCGYYYEKYVNWKRYEEDKKENEPLSLEGYYVEKECACPTAALHLQYGRYGQSQPIDNSTIEDLIREMKDNSDTIRIHPDFENAILSWYDKSSGKFFTYDMSTDKTIEVPEETFQQ